MAECVKAKYSVLIVRTLEDQQDSLGLTCAKMERECNKEDTKQ